MCALHSFIIKVPAAYAKSLRSRMLQKSWHTTVQTLVPPTLQVNGYPSSPFPTAPLVFAQKFKPLVVKNPDINTTCNAVRLSGYMQAAQL